MLVTFLTTQTSNVVGNWTLVYNHFMIGVFQKGAIIKFHIFIEFKGYRFAHNYGKRVALGIMKSTLRRRICSLCYVFSILVK